jgi:hydroxymethylpyrimidine pyrophosphatase-like HAD family hydrolase
VIKLFVLDIDGCISYPFETPDWNTISKIRDLNTLSKSREEIPSLTLCTGRPLPYAEAVAQWLDIKLPFVFESAALYSWSENRVKTILDKEPDNGRSLAPINEFKQWLNHEILPDYPELILEFSKMMDAGVVSPNKEQINRAYDRIIEQIQKNYPDLEAHRTEISVNTLLSGNNKGIGFQLISEEVGIPFDQMAYIGDSEGDIPALKKAGIAFAPSNAIDRVKQVARKIPFETSKAILHAYEEIIKMNKNGDIQ